jgi:hypothetical protein
LISFCNRSGLLAAPGACSSKVIQVSTSLNLASMSFLNSSLNSPNDCLTAFLILISRSCTALIAGSSGSSVFLTMAYISAALVALWALPLQTGHFHLQSNLLVIFVRKLYLGLLISRQSMQSICLQMLQFIALDSSYRFSSQAAQMSLPFLGFLDAFFVAFCNFQALISRQRQIKRNSGNRTQLV